MRKFVTMMNPDPPSVKGEGGMEGASGGGAGGRHQEDQPRHRRHRPVRPPLQGHKAARGLPVLGEIH